MRVKWIIGSILIMVFYGGSVLAQTTQEVLTLEESIKIALERNLQLHSAKEEIVGSEFRRREAFTNFLPTWGGQYSYTHYNSPVTLGSSLSHTSQDIFNLSTTVGETSLYRRIESCKLSSGEVGSRLLKSDCRDGTERYYPPSQSTLL